ncbi:MAG: tetratricopeptide repeat protein, partial [Myxococcota bacterium]
TPNFDTLRQKAERLPPALREASSETLLAIGYAPEDPAGAIAKARRVTEGLLKREVRRREPKAKVDRADFNQLSSKLEPVLPRTVRGHIDTVQRWGNLGAHHTDEQLTQQEAYITLNSLLALLEWEAKTYHPTRRTGRPWRWALTMLGMGVAGGVAVVAAAGGLIWIAVPDVETQTATAPAPAPVTVAEPVPTPIPAVTPTPVAPSSVTLWSRPLFPWERPEDTLPAGTTRVCDEGTLAGALPERVVGTWVRMTAWCDGTQVAGWASVSSVPTVAAAPAVAKPGSFDGEARAWFYEGAGYADAGDWAQAVAYYDKVIALVPNDPLPYERRGAALLGAGDAAAALGDLALCVSLEPKRGKCFLHAAEAYRTLGDPGWPQVLADATVYDATLARAASEIRAVEVRDLRRVQDFGDGGLPVYDRRLSAMALRRARERGVPREMCRLGAGDEVEVVAADGDWLAVRAPCSGDDRDGYVVTEWKHRPTLAR